MNKVLQAAGRVIRTEKDTGIVALMDDRFPEAGNRALFPVEWESPPAAGGEEFIRLIRAFWERHVHMQDGESEDRVPDMQIEERK
jgi:Rad3-related DNA helicase